MKRLLLVILLLESCYVYAQKSLNYAFDTNGPMGECLFPQDIKGNVRFTGVVEVEGDCNSILSDIKDNFNILQDMLKLDTKQIGKTNNSIKYRIKCPVDKQYFKLGYLDNLKFFMFDDISIICFDCLIEVADGQYKYTLNNFLTKRSLIRGNSKNEGLPNIIHWQRINSLTKERAVYAGASGVNRDSRERMYDTGVRIEFEQLLYQAEHQAINLFINGLVSLKDQADSFYSVDFNDKQVDTPITSEFFDISSYKGNLLQPGNKVFVTGMAQYELAGASGLIRQILIDSLWTVVDSPDKAHFIIEYCVNLDGRDMAYLKILSREGYCYSGMRRHSDESVKENYEIAEDIYKKDLFPLISKIVQKKTPKVLKVFEMN